MIGFLKGKILDKGQNHVLINTGSIGFVVRTIPNYLSEIGKEEEISLWTHMAVRENAIDLYGFKNKNELDIFEMLITVSGIGPKSAMTILSSANPDLIEEAIAFEDAKRLTSMSSIGQKTAEKIVNELKGKTNFNKNGKILNKNEDLDVVEALKALGYRDKDIQEAVRDIPKEIISTNEKIKHILKTMNK